jgi:hypothetical protein
MEQFIEGKNPYEILELKDGQQSSLEEIKKVCRGLAFGWWQLLVLRDTAAATDITNWHRCVLQAYRRLALVKHPDKNKKSPNAGGAQHLCYNIQPVPPSDCQGTRAAAVPSSHCCVATSSCHVCLIITTD